MAETRRVSPELAAYGSWTVGEFRSRPISDDADHEEYYRRAAMGSFLLPTKEDVDAYFAEKARHRGSLWHDIDVQVRSSDTYFDLVLATRPLDASVNVVSAARFVQLVNVYSRLDYSRSTPGSLPLIFLNYSTWPNDENDYISVAMFEEMLHCAILGHQDNMQHNPDYVGQPAWMLDMKVDVFMELIRYLPFSVDALSLRDLEELLSNVIVQGGSVAGMTPQDFDDRFRPLVGSDWMAWIYLFLYSTYRVEPELVVALFDNIELLMSEYTLSQVRPFIMENISDPIQIREMLRAGIPGDLLPSIARIRS